MLDNTPLPTYTPLPNIEPIDYQSYYSNYITNPDYYQFIVGFLIACFTVFLFCIGIKFVISFITDITSV